MFSSLAYRNYRLIFLGQLVSFTGSWMQMTAQAWLVYRLTRDPFELGFVGFLSQAPVLLLGSLGGVVADRVDRRRLIMATQTAAMLQAAALAALAISGRIEVWHIYALSLAMGVINAFDFPARQVFIGQLVPPDVRHNAIALHSSIVNGSRIFGPALAGFIIGAGGEGACFLINAVSFSAVLGSLFLIDKVAQEPAKAGGAIAEVRAGLAYAWKNPALRGLLAVLAVLSLTGMPFVVLMPIFAEEVLRSGPRGLGILMACSGVGATAGSLFLARREKSDGIEKITVKMTVFFGLALALFSNSTIFWVSCVLLTMVGAGMILQLAGVNTLLQELSAESYRGRMMGFYIMIFMGLAPFGSIMAGWLAARVGAQDAVAVGAGLCAVSGLFIYRRLPKAVRRHRGEMLLPPLGGRPLQNA